MGSTGRFVDCLIRFGTVPGHVADIDHQATEILDKANALVSAGAPGAGITYSANFDQSLAIRAAYRAGHWQTGTSGANQAEVVAAIETKLGTTYASLQGKFHIQPITTLVYGATTPWPNPLQDPTGAFTPRYHDLLMATQRFDIDWIEAYLKGGWSILGWQNQKSIAHPGAPYAVGGGVSPLPADMSAAIQARLLALAKAYP